MKIWKYPLEEGTEYRIQMPKGARILDLQLQDRVPTIWAQVDPEAEKETRSFRIIGTDQIFFDALEYVGTYQEGYLVWHVFEEK